jgi:methyltransferase (TIGR00027 family)
MDRPLVFDDPLAVRIIGERAAANLPEQPRNFVAARFRAFMAARSRFAEDELADAIARGTRQYVVLGAGLDSFAYRNPYPHLRVYEVDHPATQAWKKKRLAQTGIEIPASMTFAPVDFDRETFDDGLRAAGFDESAPAFFSWLGVTMYLEPPIVLATLRSIIELNHANGVAFDYVVPRESLGIIGKIALDRLSRRVERTGEPFRGFFEPSALVKSLREMGYVHVNDLGAEEVNARYFAGRGDGLRVSGRVGRMLSARGG